MAWRRLSFRFRIQNRSNYAAPNGEDDETI